MIIKSKIKIKFLLASEDKILTKLSQNHENLQIILSKKFIKIVLALQIFRTLDF